MITVITLSGTVTVLGIMAKVKAGEMEASTKAGLTIRSERATSKVTMVAHSEEATREIIERCRIKVSSPK